MKKLNNKILVVVLLGLAGLFAVSKIFRGSRTQTNLPAELVALDTAAVTEIRIYPNAEKNQEVRLVRGQGWQVTMGDRTAPVERGSVPGALGYFTSLKPQRLVSRNESKWKEYSVGDTSTRVTFMKGDAVLADIRIGRIGFNQQPGQQQFNPGSIFTHVRLSDDKSVYAIEGFLESAFNRPYNDWRDKALLRVPQEKVTQVKFRYPADSGFVLERRNRQWWVGNDPADSTKVKSFLAGLSHKNASTFADGYAPAGQAQVVIEVLGDGGTLATVEAWKRDKDWAVRSSHQPQVMFSSEGMGVESVMERRRNLLPDKRK